MQYVFHRSSSIPVLVSFALISVLACAASSDGRPAPGVPVIPPEGSLSTASIQGVGANASSTPVATPAQEANTASSTVSSTRKDSASSIRKDSASGIKKDSASGIKKDSAAKDPPVTVPSVKGRTKKDSLALVKAIKAGLQNPNWPVKTAPPLPGSILPARRIVAFYGNPLSKRMGILGELPPDKMLEKLDKEVAAWQKADPTTPVQPALHLIAVVAQAGPGRDGKYRLRMTDSLIEKVASWAATRNALLFLDVQVAHSSFQAELPRLVPFLKRPNVHLGLDPEFSMKPRMDRKEGAIVTHKPGARIGTMSSDDVNYAIGMLSEIVTQNNLPPKVLVIHRFTHDMLTGSKKIKLDPRVQVVIHMDGWGQPWLKYDSYRAYVESDPVQFTGFKLFYHNDTKKGDPLLTPSEVLLLNPKPNYIQYQ
jgi:hypothetical protein